MFLLFKSLAFIILLNTGFLDTSPVTPNAGLPNAGAPNAGVNNPSKPNIQVKATQFYQQKVQPRLQAFGQNVQNGANNIKTLTTNGFQNAKSIFNSKVANPITNKFQNSRLGPQSPKVETDRNIMSGIFKEINQNGKTPDHFLRNIGNKKEINLIAEQYKRNELNPTQIGQSQFGSTIKMILPSYNKGNSFLTSKETAAISKLPATAKPEDIGAALRNMPEGKRLVMADFVQGMTHYFDKTKGQSNVITPATLGTSFPKLFDTPTKLKDPRTFIADSSGKVKTIFDDPGAFYRGLGVNPNQIKTAPPLPPRNLPSSTAPQTPLNLVST